MPLVEWGPQYSVGVDAIDREHIKLLEIINRLHDLMVARIGGVHEVVADLMAYAKSHFATEEELMEQVQYPQLARHRQLHRQLATFILTLKENLDAGRAVSTREVLSFLRDWLGSHIQREDKRMGEFLVSLHKERIASAAR